MDGHKIQLITFRYFDTIEETIESFDFSLCKLGYDGENLHLGTYALFDIANKNLVPEKITYATSSIRRIIKYTNKGYKICSGGIADVLQQIISNPSILQSETEYID